MQAPVEIHYAGVVVARAEEMREVEGGELFIVTKEPLPVGTLVGVSTPEAQFNVRVAHVVETVDGADNGMRVRRLGDGDPGANLWVPPPPAKPAPAPERAAEPVNEEKAPAEVEQASEAAPEARVTSPEPAPAEAQPASPATETQAAPPDPPVKAVEAVEAPATATAADPAPAPAAEAAPAAEGTEDSAAAPAETATTERKAEQMPLIDDLPPARPTQGGNARRRTKRRK